MVEHDISRRRFLKRTGTVAVAGAALGTGTAAGAGADPAVGQKRAREIARDAADHIGERREFEEWSASGVESPQLFYARVDDGGVVAHEPRAWVFSVENGSMHAGYLAIDAAQTESPVLAYGDKPAPQDGVKRAKRAASAAGSSLGNRFIYQGGVDFGIETEDDHVAGLRGKYVKPAGTAKSLAAMTPTSKRSSNADADHGSRNLASAQAKDDYDKGEIDDWSGKAEDQVYGVPNWTETDSGGADSTDFGTGPDAWDSWDGCVPIAASMVLGYHEGIDEDDDEDREALIDRLHVAMDTDDDSGVTSWSDAADGIEDYSNGRYSYDANNFDILSEQRVQWEISSDRPVMLNMRNSAYTSGSDAGHSVCAFGYRTESCGYFCDDFYYKVYEGWEFDNGADQVLHGNWENHAITQVKK